MKATNKPENTAFYEVKEDRILIHHHSGGLSIEFTTDLKQCRKTYQPIKLYKLPKLGD